MKKLVSVLLMCSIIMCCASCSSKGEKKYYEAAFNDSVCHLIPKEEVDAVDLSGTTEPSQEQMRIYNEVISNISKKFEITKSASVIKCLPKEAFNVSESVEVCAKYNGRQNTILIPESFNETGRATLCHEYFHYLSDNDEDDGIDGMCYLLDEYELGKALNEGVTNYFSTQVYAHPKGTSIYEFETHVAKELAIVFGEENLWQTFVKGDVEALKDHFNAGVKSLYKAEKFNGLTLTPYDILQTSLDEYQYISQWMLILIEELGAQETFEIFYNNVNSVEEMLLNYAISTGHKEEVQEEMKNFLTNCSGRIDFENSTQIRELSQRK